MTPARPATVGLVACLALGGCGASEGVVVVATSWPVDACRRVEADFALAQSRPGAGVDRPASIRWVRLAPGDDPARRGLRLRGVDVVLGGSPDSYSTLADDRGLVPGDDGPGWVIARRSTVGWVDPSPHDPTASRSDRTPRALVLGDPLFDPAARAALDRFLSGRAVVDPAEILRFAASIREIPSRARQAVAASTRRPGSVAVAAIDELAQGARPSFRPFEPIVELIEGAGLLRSAPNPGDGRRLLDSVVVSSSRTGLGTDGAAIGSVRGLVWEACLVDALDAVRVVAARSRADATGVDLSAPPWPPPLVARMKEEEGSLPLITTLADQIAPDAADRSGLLDLWDRPTGSLDAARVAEIASVRGGNLARNPRLRAWLRAEWGAWARRRLGGAAGG